MSCFFISYEVQICHVPQTLFASLYKMFFFTRHYASAQIQLSSKAATVKLTKRVLSFQYHIETFNTMALQLRD